MQITIALAAALLFSSSAPERTTEIEWLDNLDAAEILARKTGKPLLAIFR